MTWVYVFGIRSIAQSAMRAGNVAVVGAFIVLPIVSLPIVSLIVG